LSVVSPVALHPESVERPALPKESALREHDHPDEERERDPVPICPAVAGDRIAATDSSERDTVRGISGDRADRLAATSA
jgi:hypothetical protein